MRHATAAAIVLLIGCFASAAPAPLTVDQVLQDLDTAGRRVKEFSADVKLTETDATGLGTSTAHAGKVFFQSRPDGSARVHVIFDRRIAGNVVREEKTEYLLDGAWLIDRNYRQKSETRRQVLRPGQKMNPLKLGEGPFPLPIGQNPAEVHKSFDVTLAAPDKEDPPNTSHLLLVPKPDTDLARKFHSIDVWMNRESLMPVRVDTTDVKQENIQSTELSHIEVNPAGGLKEADFQLPPIGPDWNQHVESLQD